MKVVSIINLKGGVGKTLTALTMAWTFVLRKQKKVLLIDNDIQANVSKVLSVHDYDAPSMEHIMEGMPAEKVKVSTEWEGLDVIPSNTNLEAASNELAMDDTSNQNLRIKEALESVQDEYDYAILDCPPGIGLNVINALCASDEVIIPIRIDKNSLDGMEELFDMIAEVKGYYNTSLKSARCLITSYRDTVMQKAGCRILTQSDYECFMTKIRYSEKLMDYTWDKPLFEFSPNCAASVDYKKFVDEFLGGECHA